MEWELLGFILAGVFSTYLLIFKETVPIPLINSNKNQRETRFDSIRGLAMIGIVLIHVHSYFIFFHPNDDLSITLFLSNFSRFSVPIFILSSAVYLKIKPDYWKSKFKHLILPYLITSIFGYLLKYQSWDVFELIEFLIFGKVFTPFYFVPLLVQFYILYYFISKYIEEKKILNISLFISLVLNLISNFAGFDDLFTKNYQPISIFNYIFFFVLGIKINKLQIREKNNKGFILNVCIVLFFIIIYVFSINGSDFKNHHLVYPLIFLLFSWEVLPLFHPKLNYILIFIGKNSIFIFLLHPFIIHYMHAIDPYTFGGAIYGYLITVLLNVGIPCIVAYLFTSQMGKFLNRPHHYP
ncbi:acyltransferase [Leptospira sp. 96542]|nr:acyltransferase [Leptospira sp. 96542]